MASAEFIINVEGAIYKNDEWLMVIRSQKEEHAPGTLSMVGGTTEFNDLDENTLEDTLRRELIEEVGIEVFDNMTYVESKKFITNIGQHVLDIVFLAEYKYGTPSAIDPKEVESVHWMTQQQINAHPNTPIWIRQSINKAQALKNNL